MTALSAVSQIVATAIVLHVLLSESVANVVVSPQLIDPGSIIVLRDQVPWLHNNGGSVALDEARGLRNELNAELTLRNHLMVATQITSHVHASCKTARIKVES